MSLLLSVVFLCLSLISSILYTAPDPLHTSILQPSSLCNISNFSQKQFLSLSFKFTQGLIYSRPMSEPESISALVESTQRLTIEDKRQAITRQLTSFYDLPPELRSIIYRHYLSSDERLLANPQQTYYEGLDLVQVPAPPLLPPGRTHLHTLAPIVPFGDDETHGAIALINEKKHRARNQEIVVGPILFNLPTDERDKYSSLPSLIHEHIFKITAENLANIGQWSSPKPIANYRRVIFEVDWQHSPFFQTSRDMFNAFRGFLTRFTGLEAVHVYYVSAGGESLNAFHENIGQGHYATMQTLFYDVKNVLKVQPHVEDIVISWGTMLGYPPQRQLGWIKGRDGSLRMFVPELQCGNLHSGDDRSDHPSEDDALWQARMDATEQLLEWNELLGVKR